LHLVEDGIRALWRVRAAVIMYLGGTIVATVLYHAVAATAAGEIDSESPPRWLPFVSTITDVSFAALWAVIQTVTFALIGRDIDRPVWKCTGASEALKRYFKIWFVINLLVILMQSLRGSMMRSEMEGPLEFLIMVTFLFTTPYGAALMHQGIHTAEDMGEALRTLFFSGRLLVQLLLVGLLQFVLYLAAMISILDAGPGTLLATLVSVLTNLPSGILDCLLFVMAWKLAMLHREARMNERDNPFDD